MTACTRNISIVAVSIAAWLIATGSTNSRASERSTERGLLEVNVTSKDSDGTVRPLGEVDLELRCDRASGFPRMKTDPKGHATIRAPYSLCTLTAKSSVADGSRQRLWTSDIEFSRKTARVDFSDDDAVLVPVLLHDDDAKYLEELRHAGIHSDVVVMTEVRRDGTVGNVIVSGLSDRKLERSVIAAFRHRQYEPALKNGWPVALSLTAHLDLGPPLLSTTPAGGREPIVPTGNVVFPVLVTKVEPIYPEKAHLARVEGNVSVQAAIDKEGNVREVTVLSSSNPIFNDSAIEAVKQRKYKPAFEDGQPVAIYSTIRIDFRLSTTPPGGHEPIMPADDVVLPVLVTKVEPIYPHPAHLARVEGNVILQAVIDKEGNVNEVTVLSSSNPMFNDSAVEAVKQRKYRPARKDGQPVAIYFSIRVDFRLR